MAKVILTVESRDPLVPAKSSRPMDPEDALLTMREYVFKVALGEYAAVYLSRENPLTTV